MRHGTIAGTLVLLIALAVGPADAGEDLTPTLRGDVDALVRLLADQGWRRVRDDGPSPTARVNRLAAAGDSKLRPVLEETWKVVTTWTAAEPYKPAARQLIRYLYGLAESGKAAAGGDSELAEEDGVVRARGGDPTGGFGFTRGRGYGRTRDESSPPYAALVKGGKLRKAAKPDVRKVLAALDGGKVAEGERFAVAQAVGEWCAVNKPAMADLLRRFDSDPASQWLLTALAWSGSPDAEPPLRMEVAALAGRVAEGREAAAPILATACWALGHLRPAALVDEIDKMQAALRDAALAASGLDVATRLDLAAIEKAADAAAKNEVLASICRRLSASQWDRSASATTTTALVKLLASSLPTADATLRTSILAASESLLYAGWRGPIAGGHSSGIGGVKDANVTGERLGPYPDMAAVLASVGRDLEKGDLGFGDAEPSIFDLEGRPGWSETPHLVSDVACPDPTMSDVPIGERAGVKLTGEFVGEWLRLTLTNVGATPIAINPVALRYATAEVTKHEYTGAPGGDRSYRQLHLTLGFMHGQPVTPADRLVSLAPKAAHTWMMTVRPEHRDLDHMCVELHDGFAVKGKTSLPPFARFDQTWIK